MRAEDPAEIKAQYQGDRRVRSIYGFFISTVGVVLMVWMPAEEWLRITIGSLILLLGGTMISSSVMKEWAEMFGSLIPFKRK